MKKIINKNAIVGQTSYQTVTKKELIKMINEAFPEDNGHIAVITTIITDEYKETGNTRNYIQSVLFNGILDRDVEFIKYE